VRRSPLQPGTRSPSMWITRWGAFAGAVLALAALVAGAFNLARQQFDHRVFAALEADKEKLRERVFSALATDKAGFADRVFAALNDRPQDLNSAIAKMLQSNADWQSTHFFMERLRTVVDSGYTFTFNISANGIADFYEFRFYADKSKQRVFGYIIGAERRVQVGKDIEVRVDGTPLKVNGEQLVGELDGQDITASLSASEENLHKLIIREIGGLASEAPRPKEPDKREARTSVKTDPTMYRADVLILVKNDYSHEEKP
jgi:hypothetical protein